VVSRVLRELHIVSRSLRELHIVSRSVWELDILSRFAGVLHVGVQCTLVCNGLEVLHIVSRSLGELHIVSRSGRSIAHSDAIPTPAYPGQLWLRMLSRVS
jgi:uncharacterized protein (DUF488 family)